MTRFPRLVSSALLFSSLAMLVAVPAFADEAEDQAAAAESAEKSESAKAAKHAAPPTAIPGAEGSDDEAGEGGGHPNRDIEPTVALFEAINRGSVASARDAINRGADLNGHNILGQTPLDMSIDLNRNPITFLLLSLRNSSSLRGDDSVGAVSTSDLRMGGGSADEDDTSKNKAHDPRYDRTGGAAQPSIGFLGFGGS
ncbi:ankyrin repeat domain-containing protein [Acetobacter lambici]|uniref:Ankyrin repeat domain-containing protein n=1 Tax=Acetobacter lambici TaxID=1332824 RepID=A0ABT1EWD9_9PROT|nr:ankyrin repeat domain-containing protein [Acetobacter lambici]MCP1241068.1 ankyrin repeat domain-containing protein [Acetobacter lambici]MCP1257260.1 ankyrin repeat domain-containing protein [Acetobacter lambici]NHO55750.1 ankyrin repeat domain-containing protein [Acetobacter lambici]